MAAEKIKRTRGAVGDEDLNSVQVLRELHLRTHSDEGGGTKINSIDRSDGHIDCAAMCMYKYRRSTARPPTCLTDRALAYLAAEARAGRLFLHPVLRQQLVFLVRAGLLGRHLADPRLGDLHVAEVALGAWGKGEEEAAGAARVESIRVQAQSDPGLFQCSPP
jgi:hypothetical protein